MKYLQTIAFVLIIGSIVVASAYGQQEVSAMEDITIIEKMIEVDKKLYELDDVDNEFNELTMSKISFKINQIKNTMLEINNANDGNSVNVDKIYTHLSNNYVKVFEKYQNDVKKYQKENGLTIQEKKLVSKVFKNKSVFDIAELQQNTIKLQEKLMENAVKETKAKKDYQELVNKIGVKLTKEANGGKVDKIHHKLAIKEIIESKKWEIAIPAIDRVIAQTNDDQAKEKLTVIKNNIEKILEKREKQSKQDQVFSLKTDGKITDIESIQFNPNEVRFESILNQIGEEEIISSMVDSEEIITEFESQQKLESAIKESDRINIIEPIFEAQLIDSLEDVKDISDDDDNELETEREKQRKDAREKKNNNSSDKAKSVQKSTGNNEDKGKKDDKGKSGNGDKGKKDDKGKKK
jgi:hypothetical protein